MTKSFSHLPRVDPHAKSTSWRSTNLVWLIGEVGVAIWRIFSCQATPPYDILMTLQAQDFGEVKVRKIEKKREKWQAGGAIQLIKTKTTTIIDFWSCLAGAKRSLKNKEKFEEANDLLLFGTHSLPSLILLFNCVKLSRQLVRYTHFLHVNFQNKTKTKNNHNINEDQT